MAEILLNWEENDYFLVRRVLTTVIENPDIRLCVWRGPGETNLTQMTRRQAITKIIEIALPGHVKCNWDQKFKPETYFNAINAKLKRLYKTYFMYLNPETKDQLTVSDYYMVIRERPYWGLVEQLGRNSPENHKTRAEVRSSKRLMKNLNGGSCEKNKARAVAEPSKESMKDLKGGSPEKNKARAVVEPSKESVKDLKGGSPEKNKARAAVEPSKESVKDLKGGYPEKNKVKVYVDLTGVDGDGSDGGPSIKTEASDESTPARPSAILGPGARVLVTSNKVTSSIETNSITNEATPMSVTPRTAENKKRPALDSGDLDALEERKLQKAREHELAVLNAKIRLVEAETELAKIRGNHEKK